MLLASLTGLSAPLALGASAVSDVRELMALPGPV